jgi:hypothetical protein
MRSYFHFLVKSSTRIKRYLISDLLYNNSGNHVGKTAENKSIGLRLDFDPFFFKPSHLSLNKNKESH